jgi:hypothetical protein
MNLKYLFNLTQNYDSKFIMIIENWIRLDQINLIYEAN